MTTMLLNDTDFLYDNPQIDTYTSVFSDLGVKWGCFTGPRELTPNLLEGLHTSGCVNLRVGIEAVDYKMVQQHRPDYSLPEMLRILDVLETCPLQKVTCYFLLGLPGQTESSLDMIVEEVLRHPRLVPRPFYLIPMPGTAVFQEAQRFGKVGSVSAYLRSLAGSSIIGVSEELPHLAIATAERISATFDKLNHIANTRNMAAKCLISA